MFDPSAIGKAMALVQKVRNIKHGARDDRAGREQVAELARQQAEQPGECSLVELDIDGKPVTIAIWGPAGTRACLPF